MQMSVAEADQSNLGETSARFLMVYEMCSTCKDVLESLELHRG